MKMESGGRMMYINSSWHLQEGSSGLRGPPDLSLHMCHPREVLPRPHSESDSDSRGSVVSSSLNHELLQTHIAWQTPVLNLPHLTAMICERLRVFLESMCVLVSCNILSHL
jgi:hypothetical protein